VDVSDRDLVLHELRILQLVREAFNFIVFFGWRVRIESFALVVKPGTEIARVRTVVPSS